MLIGELVKDVRVDYFIGSLYYMVGILIDYDKVFYWIVVEVCGGIEEGLYEKYFDE